MINFKEEARGRDCQIRIPGVCNFNPETTVLTHYRLAGTCGTGIKPDDRQAAWGCSACHDEVDRRTRHIDTEAARLCHAEGVMRTLNILIAEGKL
ncbi:DUF1364 domain-containing protein [Pectobacterium aroidearum]|uniref:DUF1364 domain-containing protein n=1 Tax=Pectobacterium aroidearum TaxID=1201031 RepID=A0AAW3SQU2_9GAMM|nr:DUF1364 domain-containing protein [Pectobacterium aroidearum]MBA5202212.1 DUF1364 domain-containing protein [Pectobacterium aroidearum]MBA5601030.1 DUF1364 domain-containing protein [Pectobacterium aroidearum]